MNKIFFNIFFILPLFASSIIAQQPPKLKGYPGSGLTFNTGVNLIAIKDNYISNQRYTGFSPSFLLDWSRLNYNTGFHLSFGVINSAKVTNYNVSANITEAELNLSYTYSIGEVKIFNDDMEFFVGPAPQLFMHIRSQNIARGALWDAYSGAFLLSAGARMDMIMPITNKWQLEGNIYSSLLSLGAKLTDPKNKSVSMVKILTAFSGLSFSSDLAVRYSLIKNISLKAGYRFNFVRLSAWDYFISARDNLNLSLTYSL